MCRDLFVFICLVLFLFVFIFSDLLPCLCRLGVHLLFSQV